MNLYSGVRLAPQTKTSVGFRGINAKSKKWKAHVLDCSVPTVKMLLEYTVWKMKWIQAKLRNHPFKIGDEW
jgi:hypothetical protein